MCEPVTAVLVASAMFSAYATYQQAESQAEASEYSAKVADQNAKTMEIVAKDSENRGANEAATMRENYRKANAQARAVAGSKGLLADTGTMGAIQDQNVEMGEMNVLTARNNAARDAWGYRVKGTDFANQAGADRFSAKSDRYNGLLTATSKLGSGLYDAGKQSKWLQKQFEE